MIHPPGKGVSPEVDPGKGNKEAMKTRKSMNTKKTTIRLPGGFALRSIRDEIKTKTMKQGIQ